MGMRILNEALRKMVNAERRGITIVKLQPMSLMMANFLNVMKYRGYIKDFQVHDPHWVGSITVELQGRIKDSKALMYRQDVQVATVDEIVRRFLPTRQWGYVVFTTPKGVMDHEEARKQRVGGKVLGYFY
eukprot:TRINITY_DN2430_c0_g1_i3.p1 TRINITY_DN2430_c0_g1~~TRINITY_DN2430_c0_g1_i3.p1  ORF type:complete len:130 (-),score=12.38 TRINITY_DN2430_c0_g1_i3:161-550(-)